MLWKRRLNFTLIVTKSFIMQATTVGPGAFVIEHQTKKRAVPRKKVCNSFPNSLRIRTWWDKNNSGYFRTTTNVLQQGKWTSSTLDVVRTFSKLQSCRLQFVISNQQNLTANSIAATKRKLLHINPLRWKSFRWKKQLKREFGKPTRIHVRKRWS